MTFFELFVTFLYIYLHCVLLCLKKVKRDEEHKLVKSSVVNDDEVVRVPLAFAMVRVMQCLPQEVMEANLPRWVLEKLFEYHSFFLGIRTGIFTKLWLYTWLNTGGTS